MNILFFLLYLYIGYRTSISIPELLGFWQLFTTTFTIAFIGSVIDWLIYLISYRLAGDFKHMADLDRHETSAAHWIFRSLFAATYCFIAKQSFMTSIVLSISIPLAEMLTFKIDSLIADIMDTVL